MKSSSRCLNFFASPAIAAVAPTIETKNNIHSSDFSHVNVKKNMQTKNPITTAFFLPNRYLISPIIGSEKHAQRIQGIAIC